MPLRKQPHIKCMISTDAAWDDRLLYGEIITILGIIRQRLRTPETRKHVDAPVGFTCSVYYISKFGINTLSRS